MGELTRRDITAILAVVVKLLATQKTFVDIIPRSTGLDIRFIALFMTASGHRKAFHGLTFGKGI